MTQRFEGRNLEDALNHAAETFGVERFQLTYHVLLEKRGFLGGVKRVVIEADVNSEASAPPAPVAEPITPRPPASPRSDRAPGPARGDRGPARGGRGRSAGGGNRERGGRGGGERGGRGGDGRGRRGRGRSGEEFRSGDFEQQFVVEAPEQGPESETAKAVRDWLEEVLDLARLNVDVRTEENETQVIVRLYGRDSRRLTDHHGELLDALQVLANKSLTGRKVQKDIELDSQEFKGQRIEELNRQAKEMADRVRRDGREQLLPAMSPIERRIVHLALQDDVEITTESRGDGFFKRVAVILRPAANEVAEQASSQES